MMRKILLLIPLAVFAVFGVMAYLGMQGEDRDELPTALAGQAPAIALTPMEGMVPFSQDDLATGQVALVNFWASWCAPCRAEHPNLVALREQGVPIFGVNYKDDPAKAQAFLAELGNPYTMGGADPNAQNALEWGVYGLPETFVIAPDGTIIMRVAGPITQRNIEARILPALEARGLSF